MTVRDASGNVIDDSQSDHRGIEIIQPLDEWPLNDSLNRTIVELKLLRSASSDSENETLNRTIVELKYNTRRFR